MDAMFTTHSALKPVALFCALLFCLAAPQARASVIQTGALKSDSALDGFGKSLAMSGDTLVAGAPYHDAGAHAEQGVAYIFVKPAAGWADTMTKAALLKASDGAAGDRFGRCVAISGDTVVVGAPNHRIGSNANQGAVYVFVKPAGGWHDNMTETAKLIIAAGSAGSYFGLSVAISDDTIAAGAPMENTWQGAAYVYDKPLAGWSGALAQTARLTASDGAASMQLGKAVAFGAGYLVATAPSATIDEKLAQGAAYVFVKPPAGWDNSTEQAKLTSSDCYYADCYFGESVAASGDTVLIGSPQWSNGGLSERGAAYLFIQPANGWAGTLIETAHLYETADYFKSGVRFGSSVFLNDEMALVASRTDNITYPCQGSAYLYRKPAGGWTASLSTTKFWETAGGPYSYFGSAIAFSGNTIVAGVSENDYAPVFQLGPTPDFYQVSTHRTSTWYPGGGVLANDTDLPPANWTAVLLTEPTHGKFSFNDDGSFEYTSRWFFQGTDNFTYAATDGTNTTPAATATILVVSNCPAEELYGRQSPEAQVLRRFRDETLQQSAIGRLLTKLYYTAAPAADVLLENAWLRQQAKSLIDALLPVIERKFCI